MSKDEMRLDYSLYEIDKLMYSQQKKPMLTPAEQFIVYNKISKWFEDKRYVMVLCRERNDYTVFNFINKDYKHAARDLQECLNNRGLVIDLQFHEEFDAWELWVKIEGNVYMFRMFECEDFIIED